MKIAYCGYDFFHHCLGDLVADGHEIAEVFSWPTDNEYDFNSKIFSLAQAVKARISMSPIGGDDMVRLRDKGVEAIISAAYPFKIPDWRPYVQYGMNLHPSLLPVGRGPWPMPWIILKGHKQSGVTIHELSDKWDGGDIVDQAAFELTERETLESLSIRSQMTARKLLKSVLNDIERAWRSKTPQGDGSYWPMPKKEDRTIRWDMPVREIDRVVRAFSKFEPFLFIGDVRYFVRKVDFWEEAHDIPVGSVAHVTNREVIYAAADGFVCLSSYQRADPT